MKTVIVTPFHNQRVALRAKRRLAEIKRTIALAKESEYDDSFVGATVLAVNTALSPTGVSAEIEPEGNTAPERLQSVEDYIGKSELFFEGIITSLKMTFSPTHKHRYDVVLNMLKDAKESVKAGKSVMNASVSRLSIGNAAWRDKRYVDDPLAECAIDLKWCLDIIHAGRNVFTKYDDGIVKDVRGLNAVSAEHYIKTFEKAKVGSDEIKRLISKPLLGGDYAHFEPSDTYKGLGVVELNTRGPYDEMYAVGERAGAPTGTAWLFGESIFDLKQTVVYVPSSFTAKLSAIEALVRELQKIEPEVTDHIWKNREDALKDALSNSGVRGHEAHAIEKFGHSVIRQGSSAMSSGFDHSMRLIRFVISLVEEIRDALVD